MMSEVIPHTPGCPDVVIMNEIRKAAIEFCEVSRYWKVVLDPIMTIPDISEYEIDQPLGQTIVLIENMQGPRWEVLPKTIEEMDYKFPRWRTQTRSGQQPEFYIMTSPLTFILHPSPSGAVQLDINASVKPSRVSDVIEGYVLDKYDTVIANGALAKLVAMPKKAWSNPDMYSYHNNLFEDGKTKAKIERAKGYSRAPIRTRAADIGRRG